ncbi:pilus assembly protein TadG-related protein [Comamonas thiooxydans]|uniref:pilus assembly protein TadG-related protein n=1 Tax=Comamonas thiooxydans TaxID=363952 RepID=UPI0021142CAF|nr:pilus assembly protein TadG-related protein [Comamonas thiooxydans]UUE94810.1 Tad domain-containing protein [Comamonas thiooxydans]
MKTDPHYWLMSRPMHGSATALRQHGAFLITFALFMLFLLGFMGIALDFGRLFVVKTELQTAMDSCALAAARELNGQSDAITRAQSAGMTAGNSNNANLQSANWNGQGKLTATDTYIRFRKQDYLTSTSDGKLARYAECQYTMSSIKLWLLQAMGAFTGDSVNWPNTGTVGARAVATRAPSQTACPIPVQFKKSKFDALNSSAGGGKGTWIVALTKSGSGSDFGWANLDGSNSAPETWSELEGKYCNTQFPKLPIGTSGVVTSAFEYWNHRFGIYKKINDTDGPEISRPDFTGYAYTPKNWNSSTGNAYPDFVAKRQAFVSCNSGASDCEAKKNVEVIDSTQLAKYGADRRLVLVPVVIDATGQVVNFACMLMLQPIPNPIKEDIYLEYRGNATDLDSPCTTTGLAGSTNGPLVPVLVR